MKKKHIISDDYEDIKETRYILDKIERKLTDYY